MSVNLRNAHYVYPKMTHEDWNDDNLFICNYYRLIETYREQDGRSCNRVTMRIGEVVGFSKEERNGLTDLLTDMIERNEMDLCSNGKVVL